MEYNDPLIGTTVGNYEIKSMIGEGAMGQVYLGEHPQIGRKVAIKVLISSLSANPEMADRFLSEAKAVNKISHPNIIQVFDFGKLPDGRLYLTMEFLEGKELEKHIEEEAPFDLKTTIEIFRQIASALDAVHKVGIVHRDLKPDNIFVMDSAAGKIVKLLDFGVAKLLEPDMGAKHKTATGLIMGTPSYMSPEQASGKVNEISAKSDLYSLGIIVYQMLSRRLPIEADIVPQVLVKHITEPPTPINTHIPDFPQSLWEVLEKSLAKTPEERYDSVIEFFNVFQEEAAAADPYIVPDVLESQVGKEYDSLGASLAGKHSSSIPPSRINHSELTDSGEQLDDFSVKKGKGGLIAVIFVLVAIAAGAVYFFVFANSDSDMEDTEIADNSSVMKADTMKAVVMKQEEMKADTMKAVVMKQEEMKPAVVVAHKLKIKVPRGSTKVNVYINDKKVFSKKTPFELDVKKGDKVVLKPLSRYYRKDIRTITVEKDETVILVRKRRSGGHSSSYSSMKTEIMKIVVKPVMKKPVMKKPVMAGVSTIKVMF